MDAAQPWGTYLVEHYHPGSSPDGLRETAAAVRHSAEAMTSEGRAVRYLRSTIIPRDEAFMSLFEAESERLVREAYARAGVEFDRISQAIAEDA